MYTWTFICAVAILSAASPFKALPVPPESSRAQEEFNSRMAEDAMGFLSKDISSIGERRAADFYSMLPKRDKVLIELQGGTMEKLEDNANLVSVRMCSPTLMDYFCFPYRLTIHIKRIVLCCWLGFSFLRLSSKISFLKLSQ
ncbi:urotensin-related peptide 1 isoform X1 [Leucoraja erinacea]|uniref:urotensin-related peptide 1 isoform X1 n=1 Tax=Leucoraja erinaceus TaxID=7782 RepID=UPI002457725A|nr:urotensin-related peptide 1 isoform X1 [Leucoraja erinacea]